MNSKIRIAIIGMGEHMMRAHVKHLIGNPNVELVAWYDPGISEGKSAQDILLSHLSNEEATAIPRLPDSFLRVSEDEIYSNPEIDAVMIGSPDKFHPDQLLAVAEAGKHAFCEKPMFGDTEGMIKVAKAFDIAKANNLTILSCHPRRFDPPILELKAILRDSNIWVNDHLGGICHFEYNFWYHEVTDAWKKNRSLLLDHFGHEIDTFRFLFPDYDKTLDQWDIRRIADGHDHYQVEMRTHVTAPYMSATFRGFRSLHAGVYQESIRLLGTKGSVIANMNNGKMFYERTGQFLEPIPKMDYDIRFKGVNDNFIRAIRGEEKPYLSIEDLIINNSTAMRLNELGRY